MNQTRLITQIARWTVLAALFLIPFLPLFVANSLFFPFITGKGFAFRILVEIALGGYVLLALAEPKYRPRFSWTFVLYGAFILWMLIADIFGVNPAKALWSNFERMEGWVTLIHVFAFFLITGAVLSADKLWRTWWMTFISGGLLITLVCIIQLLCAGHACGAQGYFAIHQGGARVDGSFGNAAYLAAYLLFTTAITLWQALESKKGSMLRYALYTLAGVQVLLIFFAETRGAIVGLVGAAAVAGLLWAIEVGGKTRTIAASGLIGLVLIIGGFYLIRDTSFVQNNHVLERAASIFSTGKELSVRTTLWGMAFNGVAERPILGWGQEGFNFVFYKYYEPSLFLQEPWFDRAHNAFIDWLVAGGVPGFLLFLLTFIFAIYALYRGGVTREERIMLIAALTAYGVQGLVVFDNLFTYVPLAAILATAHAASSRPWKRMEAMPAVSEPMLMGTAPVVLAVTVVVLWVVNVPNIAAAYDLVHAIGLRSNDITPNVVYFQKALGESTFGKQETREQLVLFAGNIASQQQGTSTALTQLTNYARTEIAKEVEAEPDDARLRMEYSLAYRISGDYANAIKQLELAHASAPKKQTILLEEGIDYWQVGDFAKARDLFYEAYNLDTSFPDVAAYAAAGDIALGEVAKGKAFLMEKVGTTTLDSEPLLLAYYQARDFTDLILVLEEQSRNQHESVQSQFRLAAAYVAAGRSQEARSIISRTVAQHPEAASQAADFLQHVPSAR